MDKGFCQKFLAGLKHVKDSVLNRYRGQMGEYDEVLTLALQEAEGLAWQTRFPHLFFPMLAEEKAQAVSKWAQRQGHMRQADLITTL